MKRLRKLLWQTEFHALLFFLGFTLLNWPFLGMFRFKPPEVFLVYLYIFWTVVILFLFLLSRIGHDSAAGDDDKQRKEHRA